jgi:2-haloacid dehalogenase
MKKYDVFLFDADGTLFDYDTAEANALKLMFDYCGLRYSEDIGLRYREMKNPAPRH